VNNAYNKRNRSLTSVIHITTKLSLICQTHAMALTQYHKSYTFPHSQELNRSHSNTTKRTESWDQSNN